MTLAISGTTGITLATQFDSASTFGFKSRIINGGMVIDQRYAGAAISAATLGSIGYMVDRWYFQGSQSAKFSAQQNQGSVTPPTGFIKYLGLTSASAYSVTSSDYFFIAQVIEGLNASDLAWGTASAATVTLSFRVYSSLTGTFGGVLTNSGASRSYPFSYSVPTANTWTTISVTIAGDTSGTWLTDTGIGINVRFGLGSGATYSGTSGAWAAANYVQPTSTVSVVGTASATFYITGVQLEKGSTATSFDFRDYGTELMLCQRYCFVPTLSLALYNGTIASTGTGADIYVRFPVTMRASPTMPTYPALANITTYSYSGNVSKATTAISSSQATKDKILILMSWSGALTAGYGVVIDSTTDLFVFTAEL